MCTSLHRVLLIVPFLFFLSDNCFSQQIIVSYDTITPSNTNIRTRRDSIFLVFDEGFHNQPVEIDINNQKYTVATFVTNNMLGYAGTVKISKLKLDEKITIKVDSVYYGDFILDKKYSYIHLNYGKNEMHIRCTNHVYNYE